MNMANQPTSNAQSRRPLIDRNSPGTIARCLAIAVLLFTYVPSGTAMTPTLLTGPVLNQANINTGSSADAPAAASGEGTAPGPQQPSQVPFLIMMVAIFAFFYLFIIRPQNKQQKEHERLVKELKKGDQIVTQGGLFGRISDFDDSNEAIVVEVAKGVRIKMLRTQVARMQGTEPTENDKKAAKGRS